MEGKTLTTREALDDFIEHVEPTLFEGNRKGNKAYYRVRNIIRARRQERAGQTPWRPVTDEWIEAILMEFAPHRYGFQKNINVILFQ